MLAGGVQRNATQAGGLDSIISALQGGNHEQYLDDHTQLAQPQALDDGNAILGHIFGSKDVSRQVAAHAATNTGIDAGILKQRLPVVASMVMGALKQHAVGGGLTNSQAGMARRCGIAAGRLAHFVPRFEQRRQRGRRGARNVFQTLKSRDGCADSWMGSARINLKPE